MRQQRRSNARGQVQYPNRRNQPDISWTVSRVDSGNIVLQPDIAAGQLLIVGVPAIHSSSTNQDAVSATLFGAELFVTFPSMQTTPTTISIITQDPAVRTGQGGFLAAGQDTLIADIQPTDPVPEMGWTQGPVTLNTIDLNFDIASNRGILPPIRQFQNQTNSDFPETILLSEGSVQLYFASGLTSGDVIVVSPVPLATSAPGAGYMVLASGTTTIP